MKSFKSFTSAMKHEMGERGRESEKEEGHGGMKGHPAVAQIAKKHGVSAEAIVAQVKKGYKFESEHTDDIDMAIDIALQHVNEFPNYYDELDKMEKKLKKEDTDPCWKGYTQVGMKNKNGKKVPNCVPSKGVPKAKGYQKEDHIAIAMGKMLDSEGAMIKNQLETIERSIALLRAQIKGDNMQIPAWVQAKITLATENILTSANYMAGKDEEVSEMIQLPSAVTSALSAYSKVSAALKPSQKTATANQQPDGKETTAVTNQPQTAASSSSSKQSTQIPSTDSKNTTIDPKTGKRIVKGIEKAVSNTAGIAKQGVGGYVSMFKPEEVSHDSQRLSSFSQFRQNSSNCQLDEEQIEEGMTLKDFKANRKKNERRAASADAEKRGHVERTWGTGRKYSPDEAKSRRSNMSDMDRSQRYRVANDPDSEHDNYPSDKTKNPNKLRKQKAMGESAAWQRKEGKNQKGGLNEKGRKSYEREHPGSDLKAPQPEGGSRRDSFCARMKGMKAKLTSAKTARDPDSRINKSLRAWNC